MGFRPLWVRSSFSIRLCSPLLCMNLDDSTALLVHLCVTRDYSCMFLRVMTFFGMKSAFGVDVGSGEILEHRTLIPASTSTLLYPHPLLSQPPFRPKWTFCPGTGTGTYRETV